MTKRNRDFDAAGEAHFGKAEWDRMEAVRWTCHLCGEALDGDVMEGRDPFGVFNWGESALCHADCGAARGLVVA